ncbi:hypothetical protein [Burkholderia contaminans]|uniref:hypothetical protein n=1 Tax=Burkholderia contaminans TaxID=488447 RepID=UPI0021AB7261|nr:hypothetical protein [Burkholderia contaminans]
MVLALHQLVSDEREVGGRVRVRQQVLERVDVGGGRREVVAVEDEVSRDDPAGVGIEIESAEQVTILAVRHQREDDYH